MESAQKFKAILVARGIPEEQADKVAASYAEELMKQFKAFSLDDLEELAQQINEKFPNP